MSLYIFEFVAKKLSRVLPRLHIFYLFVLVRLSAVFLVQTFFVPDEYYQSIEVAHQLVFGYGHITWEWREGIRSYAYPMIFAFLYKVLQIFGWDSQWAVIYVPRIAQAVLSAYSDLCFYRWSGTKKWAVFSISTSWFWYYMSSRTLINTFEASLTTIALSQFPWVGRKVDESCKFIWIVAILFVIRPTSAIIWLPLCLHHIATSQTSGFRLLVLKYIPIGLIVMSASIALDSVFHGSFIITTYNFAKLNIIRNIGAGYGTHPWHWYFTIGLLTVLGIQIVPFIMAVVVILKTRQNHPNELAMLKSIIFSIFVLSCLSHKEFRFLLPLLPLMLFMSSRYLAAWSGKAQRRWVWLVSLIIFLGNLFPAWYVGYSHQRGTLDVMNHLSQIALKHDSGSVQFLFLMPCHSTPLYSHLHVDVQVDFLTCEPDFDHHVGYVDEADQFYANPDNWWDKRYSSTGAPWPSHIICFDNIDSLLGSAVLDMYERKHQFFHTNIPISSKVGRYVVILERKKNFTQEA